MPRRTVRWPGSRRPCAALSPDGTRLAVGEPDATVTLYDLATGMQSSTETDSNQPATALAFSADGRLLATGGPLQPTRLWTVPDLRLWATLSGSDGVDALRWAEAGGALYAVAGTGQVSTWLVDPADATRAICGYLTAAFRGLPEPDCP